MKVWGLETTPLSTAKKASGAQYRNNNHAVHSFISTVLAVVILMP